MTEDYKNFWDPKNEDQIRCLAFLDRNSTAWKKVPAEMQQKAIAYGKTHKLYAVDKELQEIFGRLK